MNHYQPTTTNRGKFMVQFMVQFIVALHRSALPRNAGPQRGTSLCVARSSASRRNFAASQLVRCGKNGEEKLGNERNRKGEVNT